MKKVDFLIIGGGIAGTTAAEFIRISDSSGSIAIVTEEADRLYSRVMLPHYLRDKIPYERLYVRKPEQYKEKNIELLTNFQVEKIDTKSKIISFSKGDQIQYEKLLIASGGKVNKLKISGSDLFGVTYLRTIKDVKEVKDLMKKAKNGVVIGGGFIGIEYAQSFAHAGLKTTCVVREPNFWSSVVGENSGKLINKILEKNGVEVINNSEVSEFVGKGSLNSIKLKSDKDIPAEIAGVGIGIHMELGHLKDSGLEINKGVLTNEFLETSTQDVWAAGDIAEFNDVLFDKHHLMGNWSNAAAQGKIVGQNLVSGWGSKEREKFETISAYTISIFDGTFTFLGDPATEDTQLIERGSLETGSLGRLHLRNDQIVGASLINLPADRSALTKVIKNRVKISASKEKLKDINFELKNLLPLDNGQ